MQDDSLAGADSNFDGGDGGGGAVASGGGAAAQRHAPSTAACAQCGIRSVPLKSCARCQGVAYCGKE
jgi:hypothetical protein